MRIEKHRPLQLSVIGHDTSERLETIPGHFVVFVDTRTKRACSKCSTEGITTQPAMVYGLERALAADGLVAKVIVDKFADHLPLTRQSKRFKRDAGVDVAVSTMCGAARLREGPFIQSDATGIPRLDAPPGADICGHTATVSRLCSSPRWMAGCSSCGIFGWFFRHTADRWGGGNQLGRPV